MKSEALRASTTGSDTGGAPSFTFRLVPLADVDAATTRSWVELLDHAVQPPLGADPRILVPELGPKGRARDVQVALVESGTRVVAVLLCATTPRYAKLPLRHLANEHIGLWCHPLVAADCAAEALAALLRGLAASRAPGLLSLRGLPASGPFAEAMVAALAVRELEAIERRDFECAVAEFDAGALPAAADAAAPDAADFRLDHASRGRRKALGQDRRALERELGGPLRMLDRSDDPAAIEEFIRLQAAGWKGDVGNGGLAVAATGEDRRFIETTALHRAEGRLLVYELRGGTTTLYLSVNVRYGDRVHGVLDAYDERYARQSAGTLGRIAVVNRVGAVDGVRVYDPCIGAYYPDSSRLYAHRQPLHDLLIAVRPGWPRLVVAVLPRIRPAFLALRDAVRRVRSGARGASPAAAD